MSDEENKFLKSVFGVAALCAVVLWYLWRSPSTPTAEAIPENHGSDSVWYWRAIPASSQLSMSLVWQKIADTDDPYKALRFSLNGRESIVRISKSHDRDSSWGDIIVERNSFPVAKWVIHMAELLPFKSEWYPTNMIPTNPKWYLERDEIEARGNKLQLTTPSKGQTKFFLLPGEVLQIGEEGSWQIFLRRMGVYDTDTWEIAVPQ